MTKLRISDDLSLPLEAVTETFAFLGRRGSGKSYAAQKLAEEMHRAKAQFVVLDPVGVWYGLRLAADGKSPGLDIPVLGGLRGDIPLEPNAGALIANLIVDRGASMILDVSQFESDAAKARFAHDFADRFFQRKKSAPSAVHLFIDEAQEFCPQNPQREEGRMLHVFTRLLKLGRNFGIGASMLSQRPQEVNKKALNLAEVLFAFQLTGPQERKTVDGWIADKGIAGEDIEAELPKLERGHPHVWSPAWLKISRVVGIAERWTFDASSTPTVGKTAAARDLAPIDLERLRIDMAATIERAKAEDPRELRKQIADLKRQLAERPKESVVEKQIEYVEVPVLKNGQLDRALRLRDGLQAIVVPLAEAIAKATAGPVAAPPMPIPPRPRPVPVPRSPKAADATEQRPAVADGYLPIGERKILGACIQFPNGLRREQLTVLTGYKRSSRDAYISRLREKGLVEVHGDVICATSAGVAALPDCEPLPTGSALRSYWLARLPVGERAVLEVVIAAHPEFVPRETIDERTGYLRSSRNAYITRLAAKELVEAPLGGGVKASDNLF